MFSILCAYHSVCSICTSVIDVTTNLQNQLHLFSQLQ